jgi:hypothetical protein
MSREPAFTGLLAVDIAALTETGEEAFSTRVEADVGGNQ